MRPGLAFKPRERISTHALREEGDISLPVFFDQEYISTHALREEGDISFARVLEFIAQFLPTPSARRATRGHNRRRTGSQISTHALREEGDSVSRKTLVPGGDISTHALREEGDL